MIKNHIYRGFRILYSPKEEFNSLNKSSFEDVLAYYMWMLVLTSVATGLFNFVFSVARVLYYKFTLNIDIQYLRMLNYTLGRSTSLIFIYLFAGTFIVFAASIVLRAIFYKIKYIEMLKIMFYSLSPFLIFGWFVFSVYPILIWCLFLFVNGIRNHKAEKIKGSIKQRE